MLPAGGRVLTLSTNENPLGLVNWMHSKSIYKLFPWAGVNFWDLYFTLLIYLFLWYHIAVINRKFNYILISLILNTIVHWWFSLFSWWCMLYRFFIPKINTFLSLLELKWRYYVMLVIVPTFISILYNKHKDR